MDLDRLRKLLAAPMASLFAILILCVFVVQRPIPTGIHIPMMRARAQPLSNCEFNGFTVYLRADGKIGGGDRDAEVSQATILSRIVEARDDIQDDTVFVITAPDASYGQFVDLIAKIHNAAPADHIAVVTPAGQVDATLVPSGAHKIWADRCRFEWPALPDQSKWPAR
jgi:biopolymer transport protein ExbD